MGALSVGPDRLIPSPGSHRYGLNAPVRAIFNGSQTSHAFADFLRDPDGYRTMKVCVWLLCASSLRHTAPVPPPVKAALGA